jgi:hypothetical protein
VKEGNKMALKTAEQLVDELLRHTRPPLGCYIVIIEDKPDRDGDPNWVGATGLMEMAALARYQDKYNELQRSDPAVDWSAVEAQPGWRRQISKKLSDLR